MSAESKVILFVLFPTILVQLFMLWKGFFRMMKDRRRIKALEMKCKRYRAMAKNAAAQLRRVQSAHCLAESLAEAAIASKDRELRINRELMKQFDRSRREREEGT